MISSIDPKIYPQPTKFLPERWLPSNIDSMVKHKDAWGPFSSGPYGCIGKNLALVEVRLLTAGLILKFDVSLADGEDGHKLLMKSTDHFTLGLGDLFLKFDKRKN